MVFDAESDPLVRFAKSRGKTTAELNLFDMMRFVDFTNKENRERMVFSGVKKFVFSVVEGEGDNGVG